MTGVQTCALPICVGDIVEVQILSVEETKKRIALTMKIKKNG